jgi:hypothetical protein
VLQVPEGGSRSAHVWLPPLIQPIIGLVAVAMVILACGDTGGGLAPSPFNPTATHRPTPTATPGPSQFVVANSTASETDHGIALHLIGLDDSEGPPPAPLATLGATCQSQLVFTASKPTSLSPAVVGQISSYLLQLPGYNVPFPSPTLKPPSGVNWLPDGTACHVRLEVTNVTNLGGQPGHDISINGLDLLLHSSPTPVLLPKSNYALADICSILSVGICGAPAQGPDDAYDATIYLAGGIKGSMFLGRLSVAPGADTNLYTPPPFILQAGQTRDIDLTINVASDTALAYQVVPELHVTDGTARTLSYSTLLTNLTFGQLPVATQLWPCFGLLSNPDRLVPDSQVLYGRKGHPYCF